MAYNFVMDIRKALGSDIEEIWSIYQKVKLDRSRLGDSEYETEIQRKGFLIGLDSKADIANQINNSWLFLVAEENKKIVGYTVLEKNREYKDDEYKTWFDLSLKDIYYSSPKILAIMSLAVDPDHFGKGVASGLFQHLEKAARSSGIEYLFTVITISPVTNCPMISWRTKVGFKRLAMGKPRKELFGLKWYSSLLMYKQL